MFTVISKSNKSNIVNKLRKKKTHIAMFEQNEIFYFQFCYYRFIFEISELIINVFALILLFPILFHWPCTIMSLILYWYNGALNLTMRFESSSHNILINTTVNNGFIPEVEDTTPNG